MSGLNKLVVVFGVLVFGVAIIQLVPYGHQHTNPPPGQTVAWDSQGTLDLARRACFDCHSNETKWPWYASIAPVSWKIQTHVNEGREKLNFSAFEPANEKVAHAAGEAGETVTKGEMPPNDYQLMHPEARLTRAEKEALTRGLDATFTAFLDAGESRQSSAGEAQEAAPKGSRKREEGAGEDEHH